MVSSPPLGGGTDPEPEAPPSPPRGITDSWDKICRSLPLPFLGTRFAVPFCFKIAVPFRYRFLGQDLKFRSVTVSWDKICRSVSFRSVGLELSLDICSNTLFILSTSVVSSCVGCPWITGVGWIPVSA